MYIVVVFNHIGLDELENHIKKPHGRNYKMPPGFYLIIRFKATAKINIKKRS
jgi:hypothetical protein